MGGAVRSLITQRLETMVRASDSHQVISKRKAINTLFPYAIFLEQNGQQGMMDTILRAARVSDFDQDNHGKFMWHRVLLYVSRLFEKRSPTSLNRVISLISPFVPWKGALNNKTAVSRWAAAASAIPYTEEVGQNVIGALLQIASIDFLRPYIPIDMWEWMKRRPSLPPMYHGLLEPIAAITAYIHGLGDLELLKSYYLLTWTVRTYMSSGDFPVTESSIRENFCGAGMEMENHRKDLIERLDQILEQLSEDASMKKMKTQYTKLRDILLEVDRR